MPPLFPGLATALAVSLAVAVETRGVQGACFGPRAGGPVPGATVDGRPAPPEDACHGGTQDALLFGLPSVLRARPVPGRLASHRKGIQP